MDFGLTEEQTLFRDSVARYLADDYPFEQRQKLIAQGSGFPPDMWPRMAELGWLAAPFAEEHGGLGGGAVLVALVAEQLGRSLCATPYIASVAMAGTCLASAGSAAHTDELLPALCEGQSLLAFAHSEARSRHDRARVDTRAVQGNDGYVIDGEKAGVAFAELASHIVVSARTSGSVGDEEGVSLFVVPGDASGLFRSDYQTQEGGRASDIVLSGVTVGADALVGAPGRAYALIDEALDWGAAMGCAASVGAMWTIHNMTLEYLKSRRQFGAALGSFQALQHRMVDVFMACQLAQSVAMDAVASLERDDVTERRRAVSAAKVQLGRLGRLVGQEGIQLHGGIGMTMDVPIGHYFKQLTMAGLAHGDVDWHLNRLARMERAELHNLPADG